MPLPDPVAVPLFEAVRDCVAVPDLLLLGVPVFEAVPVAVNEGVFVKEAVLLGVIVHDPLFVPLPVADCVPVAVNEPETDAVPLAEAVGRLDGLPVCVCVIVAVPVRVLVPLLVPETLAVTVGVGVKLDVHDGVCVTV